MVLVVLILPDLLEAELEVGVMNAAIVQPQYELSARATVIAAGLPAKAVCIRTRIVGKTARPGQGTLPT